MGRGRVVYIKCLFVVILLGSCSMNSACLFDD